VKKSLAVSVLLLPALAVTALAQYRSLSEHPAIAYAQAAPHDAVARLQQAIETGATSLAFDADRGYLPALLRALHVPVSSQGLVFSRTSLQVDHIAPWSPRAIYFNDDVYVGWVQGGPIMELAAVDPALGAVFYTVNQDPGATPVITRQTRTCLQCHESDATGRIPGFIMRSTITDRHGYPVSPGAGVTTDATPIASRWGGWFVTGTIPAPHRGNAMTPALKGEMGNVDSYLAKAALTTSGTVTDLSGRFDTEPYLSPHSDAVALLVLAHQTEVHNLMTAAAYQARATPDDQLRIDGAAERLARALLFSQAAPLPGTVSGTSAFAAEFPRSGPRDARGRSLRDLDLQHRVFRYPLSFLIYSEAFDALPPVIKDHVRRRIQDALDGRDQPADAAWSADDRIAIGEILAATKPDLLTR
jgi:hypothetical protein